MTPACVLRFSEDPKQVAAQFRGKPVKLENEIIGHVHEAWVDSEGNIMGSFDYPDKIEIKAVINEVRMD